jgi:hypothetical protein
LAIEWAKSPTAIKLKSDVVAVVIEEAVLDIGLNGDEEGK